MYTAPSTFRALLKGFAALSLLALTSTAQAQTLYSDSSIFLENNDQGIGVAYDSGFQSAGAANYSGSLTGLDGNGNTQTMTITGQASDQVSYGQLHSSASLSIINPYYNPSNPVFFDGNDINPAGSPDAVFVTGLSYVHDFLQYGGNLQAGYVARYLFHLDGVNTGTESGTSLVAQIDNNNEFYSNSSTVVSADWATKDYAINGTTPQDVVIELRSSGAFVFQNQQQGQDVSGSTNFGATLTGIEVRDASGNLVSGVTLTSASGTQYNLIEAQAVPEPGAFALLTGTALFGGSLLLRRRKGRK